MFQEGFLEKLEIKIDYQFNDKNLIRQALIHRSFGNENAEYKKINNEKLELLGDAVLDLIVTEFLYNKLKDYNEGEIAKLKAVIVSEPVLAEISNEIELGEFLFLSKGENKSGGRNRDSILGDAFEALLGAIYLDKGYHKAKRFALKYLEPRINMVGQNYDLIDYKSILQEFTQKEYKIVPEYLLMEEEGPDHKKIFKMCVKIKNDIIGMGAGKNKKSAEQLAAKEACFNLKIVIDDKMI